ncbi:MAG: ATP-dependent sacrificial sulfur transferase LarE [Ignavibacteriales bacterium]|nr:ATP-dependent sacrificial sulfur transferase LarE [Ignavibacteriales bacterium]
MPKENQNIISLLNKLEHEIHSYNKTIIALSGGVDSCLVSFLCRKYLDKENAVAVISDSPSLKRKDLDVAIKFCNEHDIEYEIVHTNELNNENYLSNPINRCYFCKSELYDTLHILSNDKYTDFEIVNGNNYSDLGDYRPGLKSASENKIFSPFISCKIDKNSIRELAKHFNLSVWDKPASPCLSSRFPYGEAITKEKLKRVEEAESILNSFGFKDVRVRTTNSIAKIEVPKEDIPKLKSSFSKIEKELIELGYTQCLIDEEGFVSGKLNRVIDELQYRS